jgi:hypothetical protein
MGGAADQDQAVELIAEPSQQGLEKAADQVLDQGGHIRQIGSGRAQGWWYTAKHTASCERDMVSAPTIMPQVGGGDFSHSISAKLS